SRVVPRRCSGSPRRRRPGRCPSITAGTRAPAVPEPGPGPGPEHEPEPEPEHEPEPEPARAKARVRGPVTECPDRTQPPEPATPRIRVAAGTTSPSTTWPTVRRRSP